MSDRIKEAMRLNVGDKVSRIGVDFKTVNHGVIVFDDNADATVDWFITKQLTERETCGKKYLKRGWIEATKNNLDELLFLNIEKVQSVMKCAVCGKNGLLTFVKKPGKRGIYFCNEHEKNR